VQDPFSQLEEGTIMSYDCGRFQKLSAGCKNRKCRILGATLLLVLLSACGRQQGTPPPPKSPPRPVASMSAISTAQFILPARPALPSPGEM
jgi:hypothetical protein